VPVRTYDVIYFGRLGGLFFEIIQRSARVCSFSSPSVCKMTASPPGGNVTAVLRNHAILPRFLFRFRVPKLFFTVQVPAPVPVPALVLVPTFTIKAPVQIF
jgi:hypothetical protein